MIIKLQFKDPENLEIKKKEIRQNTWTSLHWRSRMDFACGLATGKEKERENTMVSGKREKIKDLNELHKHSNLIKGRNI